jgi:hypothetical protein
MSTIRSITLASPSVFLPTAVLVIDYCDRQHDLEITNIEMYGEPGSEKPLADFDIDDLPRDTQEIIYNAIALRLDKHGRERGLARLWSDIRKQNPDSCVVRLIQGSSI